MSSEQTNFSSGRLTSDTAVLDVPGRLTGVVMETDGTNDETLVIYDNASAASGTVLFKAILPGGDSYAYFTMPNIDALNGLYADVSGTGAAFIVYYNYG